MFLSCLGSLVSLETISAVDYETRYMEKWSMMFPHVAENGRNDFYNFKGDVFNKTRSKEDYTELGMHHPETAGLLHIKDEMRNKNFKFEVEFEYLSTNSSSGCGFWISETPSLGNYYGRNPNFEGFGVVIQPGSRPSLKFIDNEKNEKIQQLPNSFGKGHTFLYIERIGENISISLKTAAEDIVKIDSKCKYSPKYVFSISCSTGSSSSPLRIFNILGYSLMKIQAPYVKGEAKKSNRTVFIVVLLFVIGLVYYLYKKQAKDFKDKN